MIICPLRRQLTVKRPILQWYRRYAELVLSALQESGFQQFVNQLLKYEAISMYRVTAIHIRTFPRNRKSGRHLNGSATRRGVINIYPIPRPDDVENVATWYDERTLKFVQWRARATFIHELLHYKYRHREPRVRQLTQHYTHRYMQPSTSKMRRVFNRIFQLSST